MSNATSTPAGTRLGFALAGGTLDVWRYAPGEGRSPAVLLLMDAPGLRPALHEMAARIAQAGYLVWLPNLYWRQGRDITVGPTRHHPDEAANRQRLMGLVNTLGNAMVVDDVTALVARLPHDPAWDGGPIGITGYCMSGRFAVLAALALPGQVACAASWFGTRLVTDEADSPHRSMPTARAELYFAFAEHDPYVPPAVIDTLRSTLAGSGVAHCIEVYPGTEHGFVFPDRGSFHAAAAQRHWKTLFELLERRIKRPA